MKKAIVLFLALILAVGCADRENPISDNPETAFAETSATIAETEISQTKAEMNFTVAIPEDKSIVDLAIDKLYDGDYYGQYAMLYDLNSDGVPELLCNGYTYDYYDYRYGIDWLGDNVPEDMLLGFLANEGKPLRKYYDAEKDEYFYTTGRYSCIGLAGTLLEDADKYYFYADGFREENYASRGIYVDGDYENGTVRYYVPGCRVGGEELYSDRFIDFAHDENGFTILDSERSFDDGIEKYLSQYTLVDTIDTSDMIEISSDKEKVKALFTKQAKTIEERHKSNPVTLKKQPEKICFNGKYYPADSTHIDINLDEKPDLSALSEFKNLKSIYICSLVNYNSEPSMEFELNILSEITELESLNFCHLKLDGDKLAQFKKLKSLSLQNCEIELSDVAKLKNLTYLRVDFPFTYNYETQTCSTPAIDLSPISALTELEDISIGCYAESFEFIKSLTNIRMVFLACPWYKDKEVLEPLNELPNLKVVAYGGHSGNINYEPREDIMICCIK